MREVPGLLTRIYVLILRAYPPEYIETFGDEMYVTFLEGAKEASLHDELNLFILRELRDAPKVLVRAYWRVWMRKWQAGLQILHDVSTPTDLPPAPADGRESWRQVAWELSLFLITGGLMLLATYLPPASLRAGWQRDLELLGKIITPLTLPAFLLGLARGLPRWAYPFGGLLIGYYALTTNQSGLWLFLVITMIASLILSLAALITNPSPTLLPAFVRRIGQSVGLDWTRLSFGIYGAMPLAILAAFDDARTNSRTLYLATSVLTMVIAALLYCRSHEKRLQISVLLAGLTLSTWAGWMDKVAFANRLEVWIAASYPGTAELAWMLQLWLTWTLLLLSPVLLTTLYRTVTMKHAI